MSIVREDCDERQARVDRMINEFRQAQSLRLAKRNSAKADDEVVQSQRDAHAQAAAEASTPSLK